MRTMMNSTQFVNSKSARIKKRFALAPLAHACALACAVMVNTSAVAATPIMPSVLTPTPPVALKRVGGVNTAHNAKVARVVVEVEKDSLPADGVSGNTITVKLFDAKDRVITEPVVITIEHSAGRVLLPGAKTDEMGPGRLDIDRTTPGIQFTIQGGQGSFRLLAPHEPTDVKLRITAGAAVAEGTIGYVPEARDLLAVGLIEGIIAVRKEKATGILPSRIDDAFERELRFWSRNSSNGKANVGARVAFFIKGTIRGDVLLTMAADSDKDVKERLYRDVDPNKYYPVYGDSSIVGFDAKSRERLYVRLDKGKTYALYGDFNTGDGFSQMAQGGAVASLKMRNLGNYNRSATGIRLHHEDKNIVANAWATYDTLKNLVEEYRANGTSGPYSVASRQAVEGTEKIEIITRDRNALDRIINVQPQIRMVDYSFEPFSGRIMFKAPIASVDVNGNPQSIRISYEAEQGGSRFLTAGADAQLKLGKGLEVGASVVRDENPLSPYQLSSLNFGAKLNERSGVVVEVAQSKATRWSSGAGLTSTPSGASGEIRDNLDGRAVRVEGNYQQGRLDAKAWWMKADRGFYNPSASVSEGRTEAGLGAHFQVNDAIGLYGQIQQSVDGLKPGEPSRRAAAVGVNWSVNQRLNVDASLRSAREDAGFGPNAAIAGNAQPGGGFFGNGADPVNPSTGTSVLPFTYGNLAAVGTANATFANATSLRLAAMFRVSENWSLLGEVEGGTDRQNRFAIGSHYQINERSRAYARYESTTGLTSASSLNPGDRSNSFVLGIDNSFNNGPTVFSEFRLRDAVGSQIAVSRDQQLATGVRNTWNLREGLALTASAEYLKILAGRSRDALALASGVDYSLSDLSKLSARLEWRRLQDDPATIGLNDAQTQYLSTISLARKLSRDWTLLARNYAFYQDGSALGTRLENRFQIGGAWRPVDHNRWNMLSRYEFKTVRDQTRVSASSALAPENYRAHILSLHADYHPSRPWWFSGRVAAKSSFDRTLPAAQRSYAAYLMGLRAVYDITENWDIGVLASQLWSPSGASGKSRQHALGLEVGYLLQQNLWLSLGYNATGFTDRDLTGTDYTAKGPYLRLRFKFDETLFSGRNKDVNRALDR